MLPFTAPGPISHPSVRAVSRDRSVARGSDRTCGTVGRTGRLAATAGQPWVSVPLFVTRFHSQGIPEGQETIRGAETGCCPPRFYSSGGNCTKYSVSLGFQNLRSGPYEVVSEASELAFLDYKNRNLCIKTLVFLHFYNVFILHPDGPSLS